MRELKATSDEIQRANDMASEMGVLRNSITSGGGSQAGFLAEIVVARHIGATQANTYDYDLVMPDGRTIDVKAKRTGVKPRDHYECSVAAYNTKQDCDYYAFCRVLNDMSTVWILGIIKKKDYYSRATKRLKGDKDPSNNFTFKSDAYNLKISELNPSR
jgi:hypothetical protein|tara:strand:- start:1090 stop:1566 length:477 start_codon:yes stop_codon:yes gene_type:complete